MKKIFMLLAVVLLMFSQGCSSGGGGGDDGEETTPISASYSISGTISGAVQSGVTITLTGVATASTTTDSGGNYTFTGLVNGNYTVTPSLAGYTFSPSSTAVTVSGENITNINFTATAMTYSISGTVSGAVVSDVTITLTGTGSVTTTTDSSGNYSFSGAANGNYTITPSFAGYTFSPSNTAVTVSGANITNINFTATVMTYSISGTVSGAVVSDVTITLTGTGSVTTTTDSSGNYSFIGAANGNYTITASKTGYTYTPASISVTVNNANVTGQNFAQTFTISGTVTSGNICYSGTEVTVTLTGTGSVSTTTDSNGNYSFSGAANGNYTITASKTGYTYTPASISVTVNNANFTGQNFIFSVPLAQTSDTVQLRKEGRCLVDNNGRVVLLHGINAVYKIAPFYPPDSAAGFTTDDARWLYDNGFNTVRTGTIFSGIMPQKGVISEDYLTNLDRIVQLLASNKQWILLDFHQDMYNTAFQGNGFPDWAVYPYSGIAPTLGFPMNYFTPIVSAQYDQFYLNFNNVAFQYAAAWQAVAGKWKDQPYLMGYDIINEPWPGSIWPTCVSLSSGCTLGDAVLQSFQTYVLKAIRVIDNNNIVWFEPSPLFDFGFPNNYYNETGIAGEKQLGFSFHSYCMSSMVAEMIYSSSTGVPGCDISHQITMDNAQKTMTNINAAGLLSEFGASDNIDDIKKATQVADSKFVGWQYWHYKGWGDPTTQSQESSQSLFNNDADLSSLKIDKARVLIRPYPQYTAGMPIVLSFNPDTSVMHYEYTPRNASAKTEIYVPTHIHYISGYQLNTEGVRNVQSMDGGRRLIIEEEPTATKVVIDIRP